MTRRTYVRELLTEEWDRSVAGKLNVATLTVIFPLCLIIIAVFTWLGTP